MLGPLGVPCGPINDMAHTFEHPQVKHRGMRLELEHPSAGMVPLVASPMRFTRHPIVYDRPPPVLGEHTEEVLSGLLEMSPTRSPSLRAGRVLDPVAPKPSCRSRCRRPRGAARRGARLLAEPLRFPAVGACLFVDGFMPALPAGSPSVLDGITGRALRWRERAPSPLVCRGTARAARRCWRPGPPTGRAPRGSATAASAEGAFCCRFASASVLIIA